MLTQVIYDMIIIYKIRAILLTSWSISVSDSIYRISSHAKFSSHLSGNRGMNLHEDLYACMILLLHFSMYLALIASYLRICFDETASSTLSIDPNQHHQTLQYAKQISTKDHMNSLISNSNVYKADNISHSGRVNMLCWLQRWKLHYFELNQTELNWFEDDNDGCKIWLGYFKLTSKCSIKKSSDIEFLLRNDETRGKIKFRCLDPEECNKWIYMLSKGIKSLQKASKNKDAVDSPSLHSTAMRYLITRDILATNERIVFSGYVKRIGKLLRMESTRYLVLTSEPRLFYINPEKVSLQSKNIIPWSNDWDVQMMKVSKDCLKIASGSKTYEFIPLLSSVDDWIASLQKVTKKEAH